MPHGSAKSNATSLEKTAQLVARRLKDAPHPSAAKAAQQDVSAMSSSGVMCDVHSHHVHPSMCDVEQVLNVSGCKRVTDAGVAAVAAACPHLTELDLTR